MEVRKRDGSIVDFNRSKIEEVVKRVTSRHFLNINVKAFTASLELTLYDGIPTSDIHEQVIKLAVSRIEDTDKGYMYDKLAAGLLKQQLYKKVYNRSTPFSLSQILDINYKAGYYSDNLKSTYSEEEITELNSYIDHDRDFNFTYAGLQQMILKYLVVDKSNGNIYETPQVAFMLIAMFGFANDSKRNVEMVKDFYDALSTFKINMPTPIMSGLRRYNQFSSCCVIDVEDSLNSIIESNKVVAKYTADRAGIGLNFSRIRGINAKIRGGEVMHSGITPLLKVPAYTTRSLMQGGVRGGNSTTTLVWWHWEIQTFVSLKTNRGTAESSIRNMDYSVAFTRLLRERAHENKDVTLFSPDDVPELMEATFTGDNVFFEEVYEQCELNTDIRKRVVSARLLINEIMLARYETGRVYIFNADSINSHTPLGEPIVMSNLCQELANHTKPIIEIPLEERVKYEKVTEKDIKELREYNYGEVGMCTLSNINLGKLDNIDEIPNLASILVRFLDNLLSIQNYPILEARMSTYKNRYLGIGIGDVFHLLEKGYVNYNTQAGMNLIHRWVESFQYFVMWASVDLAVERGTAPNFHNTHRSIGTLPIDTYNKNVDSLVTEPLHQDWDLLRAQIKRFGMRNNTLTMIPPAASSSIVSNCTAGIDPPRQRFISKVSKVGALPSLLPEGDKYQYTDLAWNIHNGDYVKFISVIQKFIDQSISTNLYYFPDKVDLNLGDLIRDDATAYKYGLKTMYYMNVNDEAYEGDDDECAGGGCSV